MKPEDLEKLGLTKNEATVYLALVELGSVSSGVIIKKTELHSNIVYTNLEKLIKKGLVSYVIKANRKYFEAASPKQILYLLKQEEKKSKEKIALAEEILPKIEELKKFKSKEEATIYKGRKGIISVLNDMLKVKEISSFGASSKLIEKVSYFQKYFFPKWHKIRIKNKIKLKILFSAENKERGKELSKLNLTEIRYLPKEYSSPISTIIYEEKVAIILWSSEPFAFVTKSKEVSEGVKKYFKLLWKIAKN